MSRQTLLMLTCSAFVLHLFPARGQQSAKIAETERAPVMDANFWDKMAASYEQKAHPLSVRFSRRLFEQLPVHEGTTVLDIATGTGAAALIAAERGASVTAIDFSGKMLEQLERRQIETIKTFKMDGHALKFQDGSFDVSVSVFGIMLFRDWQQGFREMVRVTKPGGTCGLVVWDSPKGAGLNRIVADCCEELGIELPDRPVPAGMKLLADPEHLRQALLEEGLMNIEVTKVHETMEFRLKEVFSANPLADRLSPAQQESVLRLLRQKQTPQLRLIKADDWKLSFQSSALIGIGVRR